MPTQRYGRVLFGGWVHPKEGFGSSCETDDPLYFDLRQKSSANDKVNMDVSHDRSGLAAAEDRSS